MSGSPTAVDADLEATFNALTDGKVNEEAAPPATKPPADDSTQEVDMNNLSDMLDGEAQASTMTTPVEGRRIAMPSEERGVELIHEAMDF